MRKTIVVLGAILIVFMLSFTLAGNDGKINVMIKYKDVKSLQAKSVLKNSASIALEKKYSISKDVSTFEVKESDLEALKNDPNVEYVDVVETKHLNLQRSVPLVNASLSWNLIVNGTNLTGYGQTICVIDSGINSTHSALSGKVLATYCYCSADSGRAVNANCCPGGVAESTNAIDENGHGTHVAGIAAANGTINGVAIGAKIVAIRVFDNDTDPIAIDPDIVKAINWCVNNATLYNISVISMSLGGALHSGYCDSSNAATAAAIDAAVAKNISVVVSAGNDASSTQIEEPACDQNAIPVGNSYSADFGQISWSIGCTDTTTFADKIACSSSRNSLVKLFAPGAVINSTWGNGSYAVLGGTSMSAPHVSGAIAIINQFLRGTGQTKTPKQVENILYITGKNITEGSNVFARINIYGALNYLENINVLLVSPVNGTYTNRNQSYNCSATTTSSLSNLTFYFWNSTGLEYTNFTNVSGVSNSSIFYYNFTKEGNYSWNCRAAASVGSILASSNNSITYDTTKPVINVVLPINGSMYGLGRFNVTLSEPGICVYSLNNGRTNVTMQNASTAFGAIDASLINASYNVTYYCNDSAGNLNLSSKVFFDIDSTDPNVTLIEPYPENVSSSSVTKIFYYNVSSARNITGCDLIVNSTVLASNASAVSNLTNNISYTFSPGTYAWQINCTDDYGNVGNSSSIVFLVSSPPAPATSSSGGGGGGGGGSISNVYNAGSAISDGYTRELAKGEGIKFEISTSSGTGGTHSLTINKVENDYVNLTLRSDPLNVIISVGQEKKFNLTSSSYYDLIVRLGSIKNGKANLTIQGINEPIITQKPVENSTEVRKYHLTDQSDSGQLVSNNYVIKWGYIALGILASILIIILLIRLFMIRRKKYLEYEDSGKIRKRKYPKHKLV